MDLGYDHSLKFFSWSPDRELNPQYRDVPDIPKAGATVTHLDPNGDECMSGIHFDIPEVHRIFKPKNCWQVDSWEPLTFSPSLLCTRCNDHGFIREGKWVVA